MQEYVTRVERLPDGSLCTDLYGGGRRMYLEPVRTLRHGRRRAYDVLCTAVDADSGADPSVGSAVLGPDCPVMGGSTPGALSTGTAEPGTGVGSPTGPAVEGFSARAAAEAVRSAAAAPSADAALRAVIEMALRRGPWAAAGISVLGPGGLMRPAACSGERAANADRLQIEVGQGPCLDAVRPEPDGACTAPVVVAVDLSTEQRWPRWASAAAALGFRAVVALRLFTDHTVGSISLYARHPGVDSGALQDAQVVATLASVVLARVCSELDLWRAVESRGLIGQAQGMLMQRYGVTADTAFAVLRRYSQQHNTKLVVLAEQLTTTGELPDLPQPHPVNKCPRHERSPDRAGPASKPDSFGPHQAPDAKCVPQQQVSPSKGDEGMTFTAADPVGSGLSYRVTEVDGHPPNGLNDFAGQTRLTLVKGGMTHRLIGDGNPTGTWVRFHQKDPGSDDRDVRVWAITDGGSGTFLAEPVAAF